MATFKAFMVIVGYFGFLGLVVWCIGNVTLDDLTCNHYDKEK